MFVKNDLFRFTTPYLAVPDPLEATSDATGPNTSARRLPRPRNGLVKNLVKILVKIWAILDQTAWALWRQIAQFWGIGST